MNRLGGTAHSTQVGPAVVWHSTLFLKEPEVVWTGTHTGPLVGPAGTMPPSHRRIEARATLWLQLEGNRAREVHHHLDMLTMLQQLGAIPAQG